MIPCQEDEKHLKSRMFKVTVTSKNLTRGVKSRGILLTMNRVLLKIHLYKNEIIREGAQIKRIPTQTCSVSTLTPDVLKAHISVTYNIFVMTVIGMFYCIPKAEATFHVETKDITKASISAQWLSNCLEYYLNVAAKHWRSMQQSAAILPHRCQHNLCCC